MEFGGGARIERCIQITYAVRSRTIFPATVRRHYTRSITVSLELAHAMLHAFCDMHVPRNATVCEVVRHVASAVFSPMQEYTVYIVNGSAYERFQCINRQENLIYFRRACDFMNANKYEMIRRFAAAAIDDRVGAVCWNGNCGCHGKAVRCVHRKSSCLRCVRLVLVRKSG